MEGARERLADETAGKPLERSAGRGTGPEVYQPGDCLRTDLAIGSRRRRNRKPVRTRTEESIPGRVESSPGVCAARSTGGSDEARDRTAHGLATAQRARLPVGERSETRIQAAFVLTRWRARLSAQRLSCSRKGPVEGTGLPPGTVLISGARPDSKRIGTVRPVGASRVRGECAGCL